MAKLLVSNSLELAGKDSTQDLRNFFSVFSIDSLGKNIFFESAMWHSHKKKQMLFWTASLDGLGARHRRTYLEYYMQSWDPYFKNNMENLERVQTWITKL